MKRYLIITLLVWLSTLVFYLGGLLVVDPYQVFHKPWVRDAYFVRDMRVQASGIINNSDFDSAIVGTSIAANFSPAEASRTFSRHFVNLSLDGSFMTERSVVLDDLLKRKKISAIIYSLDGFDKDTLQNTPIEPYLYLYDRSRINDVQLYATLKYANFLVCRNIVFPGKSACPNTTDLEHVTEWASNREHAKRFGGLDKWLAAKNNIQVKGALREISDAIRTIHSQAPAPVDRSHVLKAASGRMRIIDENLVRYISGHPSVRYYLFFPPYSRLKYAILKQSNPEGFEVYLETIRSVVRECEKYGNVEVFGFETEAFPDDIANYKDTTHYHPRFNSKMLTWMKNGRHRLTPANVDAYIETISHLAAAYRIDAIGNKITSYLEQGGDAGSHP